MCSLALHVPLLGSYWHGEIEKLLTLIQECFPCLCVIHHMYNHVLYLYEHYYCDLCILDCIISPNLDTLTIANGLQRDVELHCLCMDNNGMMITGTTWFHNGSSVTTTRNTRDASITAPYLINTTPIILNINAPFTTDSSHTGTYACSPNSMSSTPPGDAITLNAGSEYVAKQKHPGCSVGRYQYFTSGIWSKWYLVFHGILILLVQLSTSNCRILL